MNNTQEAKEIINNCRIAIDDGAPFVKLDKEDIDKLYAALQRDNHNLLLSELFELSQQAIDSANDCKGYALKLRETLKEMQ